MTYATPLRDVRFCLDELADLPGVLALPGFEAFSPDVVQAVLDENARFVESEIAPINRAGDIHPPRWQDGKVTATPGFAAAFRHYAAGGWQGLSHPEQWGGQGLPKLVAAPARENLNAANMAFSLCPLLTDGVIEALLHVGSPEQRQRYVPSLVAGQWTGTMNLTEPQAGSDLAQVTTRAVPQSDGTYRLTGQKIYITYGEHDMAENIVHLVLARLPDAPPGVKGISLFIVPKYLIKEDGTLGQRNDVWCASIEHKLGIHGSPTAVLLYGAGKGEVGEGAIGELVGAPHHGLQYMFIMMNAARFAVGQQGIAVSERACQLAAEYARTRIQGRAVEGSAAPVAIERHPDVQRMLMTMQSLTQASRALSYMGAAAHDLATHHPDESVRQREQAVYEYLVPVIKGFATESSVEITSLGIQVHGGMGYIEETGAAQLLRDARILPIYEGTTAIQANDLIGRKMLRDGGAVARALIGAMKADIDRFAAASAGAAGGLTAGTPVAGTSVAGTPVAGASMVHAQSPAWRSCQANFQDAIHHYEQAALKLMTFGLGNPRAVFAASVPYLMLTGIVLGGWQMMRAALKCAEHINAGTQDDFYSHKLATALFYGLQILPRAGTYAQAVATADQADSLGQVFIS